MAINNSNEQFDSVFDSARKSVASLIELNIETMTKMNSYTPQIISMFQAKKPEAFMDAQASLFAAAGNNLIEYTQKAYSIVLEAATETNKAFVQNFRQSGTKE